MISNGDATVLLSAIVLDRKIYKQALKLDDPIFDPAVQYAHDFLCKKFMEMSEEAGEPVTLPMLSARLSDAIETLGPEDAEWIEDIQELFFHIQEHKNEPVAEKYVTELLQTIANEQTQKGAEELLSSVLSRESPSSYQSALMESMTKLTASKSMDTGASESYILPLEHLEELMVDSKAWPTGVGWFDEVSEGGMRASLLWGFLAPSGGGKTTFAMQIGMNWIKQSDQHHVAIFSYEQPPEGDIMARILCQATGESVNVFRDKRLDQLDPDLKTRVVERTKNITKRFHFFDFSKPGTGFRGLLDIEEGLRHAGLLKTRGEVDSETTPPVIVFLDWLIPFLQRKMSLEGKTAIGGDLRGTGTQIMDEIKAFKNKYNVTIVINHQLKVAAAKASAVRKPDLSDSAEWGGFCWMLDNCWGVGSRTDANITILASTKARANATTEKYLKLDGEYCRFVDVSNDYMITNGKMVNKTMQTTRGSRKTSKNVADMIAKNRMEKSSLPKDALALSKEFT